MAWMKRSRYFTAISLSILLPIVAVANLVQAQPSQSGIKIASIYGANIKFKSPKNGAPPATAGGATRGRCLSGTKTMTALTPKDHIGQTIAERPSFFVAVPRSPAKTAELLLLNADGTDVVYQKLFPLPITPGIVRLNLPKDAPALQVGKRYQWFVTLNCNPRDPSGNPTVEGWIERIEPSLTLKKALAKTELKQRPDLYAESGIWHETLAALADLRRQTPNNSKVQSDWQELLKSAGLDAVANELLAN
jgi:hypothetical protein